MESASSHGQRSRDHDPGLHRYLTRDAYNGALADLDLATDPFTGNRYAFAGGNPITGIELDGQFRSPCSSWRASTPHPPLNMSAGQLWEGATASVRQAWTSGNKAEAAGRALWAGLSTIALPAAKALSTAGAEATAAKGADEFVATPRGTVYDIPKGWVGRTADNGKGLCTNVLAQLVMRI